MHLEDAHQLLDLLYLVQLLRFLVATSELDKVSIEQNFEDVSFVLLMNVRSFSIIFWGHYSIFD